MKISGQASKIEINYPTISAPTFSQLLHDQSIILQHYKTHLPLSHAPGNVSSSSGRPITSAQTTATVRSRNHDKKHSIGDCKAIDMPTHNMPNYQSYSFASTRKSNI